MIRSSILTPFLLIILICSGFYFVSKSNSFVGEDFRVNYETKDGMFHGSYSSFYANGKKKAEGKFVANQRHGNWKVYDSTGKLMVIREYTNDYEFKQIYPQTKSKVVVPNQKLARNANGIYPYREIIEKHVVRSKRTWRYIQRSIVNPIFSEDILFNALMDSVLSGNLQGYDPVDDEFRIKLSKETIRRFSDTLKNEVLGYKIKEDWFFDTDRNTSEKRIIGICPVLKNIDEGEDSIDVCWFYFPEIRNTLSAIKVEYSNYALNVKTVDDLFFFHCFPSVIYKETNVKNQSLNDYCKTNAAFVQEHLRIEMELIETEHELWILHSN